MAEERQCMCTTPEITIKLNKQGPQGKVGPQGEPGFSPYIGVANDTPSQYILRITNEDGDYLTPNLKANIPLGGGTGDVLTKNSNVDGDCSFKALPYASTSQQGVVYLATTEEALLGDPDYAITGEVLLGVLANKIGNGTITLTQGGVTKGTFTTNQAGNTSISLDGIPTNLVTTDTVQTITADKTMANIILANGKKLQYSDGYNILDAFSVNGIGGLVFGNTTATTEIKSPGAVTINRNGSNYTNIDSGNISSYTTTYTTGDPLYIDTGNVIKMYYDSGKGLYVSGQSLAVRVDGTTIDFDNSGNLSYVGSTGPSYSAGTGIDITNNTISIDDTVVATQNDISNMVTTDTSQTITASKNFSNIINLTRETGAVISFGNSATLDSTTRYKTITSPMVTSTGATSGGRVLSVKTSGDGISEFSTDLFVGDSTYSKLTLASNTAIDVTRGSDTYVNIDSGNIGTYAITSNPVMVGADGTNAGTAGLVPQPSATDNTKFLKGDGTFAEIPLPDMSNYYNKSETDGLLDEKQNVLSPNSPLSIAEYTKSNVEGYTVDLDGYLVPTNATASLTYSSSPMSITVPIDSDTNDWDCSYIDIPYTFGQLVSTGKDNQGFNKTLWGQCCFGYFDNGCFIPVIAFITYSGSAGNYAYAMINTGTGTVINNTRTFSLTEAGGTYYTRNDAWNRTSADIPSYSNLFSLNVNSANNVSVMFPYRYYISTYREYHQYIKRFDLTISASQFEAFQSITTCRIFTGSYKLRDTIGLFATVPTITDTIVDTGEGLGTNLFDLSGETTQTYLDLNIGSGLAVSNGALVNTNPTAYSLPTASTSTLGGVKVDGTSITIDSSGVISSPGGGGTITNIDGGNA